VGEFEDKLRAASAEFNVLDRVVIVSLGATFAPARAELTGELWPKAEPMIAGAELAELLKLAYDRECAAKRREAWRAAEFWTHVADAFLRAIEEGTRREGGP